MSAGPVRRGFAARPGDAERWVKAHEPPHSPSVPPNSARLTIDVTPAMRRRLKLAALRRVTTVAEMLRTLFEGEFPDAAEDPS
jgi:hypothetical protein